MAHNAHMVVILEVQMPLWSAQLPPSSSSVCPKYPLVIPGALLPEASIRLTNSAFRNGDIGLLLGVL